LLIKNGCFVIFPVQEGDLQHKDRYAHQFIALAVLFFTLKHEISEGKEAMPVTSSGRTNKKAPFLLSLKTKLAGLRGREI